jgi:hypothetical protein
VPLTGDGNQMPASAPGALLVRWDPIGEGPPECGPLGSPSFRLPRGDSAGAVLPSLVMLQAGMCHSARKWSWTRRIAVEPSPTAAATRFTDPYRTSPTAKIPGRLDSRNIGMRLSGHS